VVLIAVLALGALIVWRTEAVLRTAIPVVRSVVERKLAVEERLAAVEEAKIRPREKQAREPGMPPQLLRMAMQESEPWARQDAVRAMSELAELTGGDWDKVQQNAILGITDPN